MKTISIILLVILMSIMGMYLLSCDDNPTKPVSVKDYPVYFIEHYGKLFTYHPVTQILDSADLPIVVDDQSWVVVSADGEKLYVGENTSIYVFESGTLNYITEIPYFSRNPVVMSPDNNLMAVEEADLVILNTDDYSVFYQDTLGISNGTFTADSKRYIGINTEGIPGIPRVYTLDLSVTPPTSYNRDFTEGGSIAHMSITPDGNKWLMYIRLRTFLSAHVVYDVGLDSVMFVHYLSPGYGASTSTRDGKYAIYGNPGRDYVVIGNDSLYLFDLENNRIDEVVQVTHSIDSVTPLFFLFGRSVVTPDNRWLIGANSTLGINNAGWIVLYDLSKRKFVDFKMLNYDYFSNLSVQHMK